MELLTSFSRSLAGYPPWLVYSCLAIVGALAVCILIKLIKWSFYFLIGATVLCGFGLAAWYLLR